MLRKKYRTKNNKTSVGYKNYVRSLLFINFFMYVLELESNDTKM